MRTRSLIFALVIISGCAAPDTEHQKDGQAVAAKAEITERASNYLAVLTQGDAEAASDYYTDDASLVGPGMDMDRAGLSEFMRAFFDAGNRVEIIDRRTIEIFVHDGAAYEMARAEETLLNSDGTPLDTLRNNLFIRWERGTDGVWRFDRVLSSPVEQTN